MSLSSLYLEAFKQVAVERNFSVAAKKLHITQSALSQRVLNLEKDIGISLFIRESQGVLLTETGQRLLRFCQAKDALEEEFWGDQNAHGELSGIIRIGAFSSITKSILLPLLAPFLKENTKVQLDIKSRELRQLPSILMSGEVDFILSTEPLEKHGVENHFLGHETNVLVRSSLKSSIRGVYLDHDEHDSTTFDFLSLQGKENQSFKRSYPDDVDSIIEGVRLGMGEAVVPLHLIEGMRGIEVMKGQKSLKVPIYLVYYTQSYYTRLQVNVRERILSEFAKRL